MDRAEPVQPMQTPEERFASWIGQQDRPFPSHEWVEDWSRARCDEVSQWAVLVTDPPNTRNSAGVRLLAGDLAECAASHTAWAEGASDSSSNEFYLGVVSTLRKQRCLHSAQACPMESPQTNQVSAVLIATLSAETCLSKGRIEQPLDRSQSRGAQDGILLITNSIPTELASKAVAQDDTDELDRMRENQDEQRWVDEREKIMERTRPEASTIEAYGWTQVEEYEDIQDDVTFADDV